MKLVTRNNPLLNCFTVVLLICDILSIICAAFTYGNTFTNSLHNFTTDTFMDFFNSIIYGKTPYEKGVIYPPLINCIYGLIGRFIPKEIFLNSVECRSSQIGLMVYLITLLVQIALLRFILEKSNAFDEITIWLILLSYPFIFTYERGNPILLSLIFLFIYVRYYDSEDKKQKFIAYCCLAVSTSIKIYPAIFGLLTLKKGKTRDTAKLVIIGLVVFFTPFVFLVGENRNPLSLVHNILSTSQYMNNQGLGFKLNTSNLMELIGDVYNIDTTVITKVILLVFIVATMAITLIYHGKEWKIICLLSLLMIEVPGFSFEYCLIYMTIPLMYFIESEKPSAINYIYLAMFSMLFVNIPVIHQSLFETLENDYYKLNYQTVMQMIVVFVFTALLIIDCLHDIGASAPRVGKSPSAKAL